MGKGCDVSHRHFGAVDNHYNYCFDTLPMANPTSKDTQEHVDILILHGMSLTLVEYLQTLFESLGLSAGNVQDQFSQRQPQDRKVDYYIKRCSTALVLATFDEAEPASVNARPNVYDEIARCRKIKPLETLILQEVKDGSSVNLPGNIEGQVVVIPFETRELQKMIPQLLRELKGRGLISRVRVVESKVGAANILSSFLDRMDSLWEEQFDDAWNNIHRKDYDAESNFSLVLDRFFQEYQRVFSALIRDNKVGAELVAVCNTAYDKAENLAARAWEYVAEAKMEIADNLMERATDPFKNRELYERASAKLRYAKSRDAPSDKMPAFREAITQIDLYVANERLRG